MEEDSSRPGAGEAAAIRAVMDKIVKGLTAAGRDTGVNALARQFGCSPATIKKRKAGERRLPRAFVDAAAAAAGLRRAELYLDLGWLPAEEVLREEPGSIARSVEEIATSVVRLSNRLSQSHAVRRSALEAAVAAVLTSPSARDRYAATLSVIASGARYRVPTYTVAEFRLRNGAAPLPLDQAVDLAATQGIPAPAKLPEPAGRPHLAVRLELRALTEDARRNGDETSWQGDPGTRTWQGAAETWPTHLLVQSALTGGSSAVAHRPWAPREPHPLVVIGSGYGAGPAAALLAESLGWQFVLVHKGMTVTSRGEVVSVDRHWESGRTLAWNAVARHIGERAEDDPWRAVVLVRPQSFAGAHSADERGALEALRTTPARVIYARSPIGYLDWWAARQQAMSAEFDAAGWVRDRSRLLERIERALAGRPLAHRDLRLELPAAEGPLEPATPFLPAEITDHQARAAWAALEWLNIEVNTGLPRLTSVLRRSVLADLLPALSADPLRISRSG